MGATALVLAALVVLTLAACGGASAPAAVTATLYGSAPGDCLPAPDGPVFVDVVPAAAPSATPVASALTSSSQGGWFTVSLPPGRYVARIAAAPGVYRTAAPVALAPGAEAEAHFRWGQ